MWWLVFFFSCLNFLKFSTTNEQETKAFLREIRWGPAGTRRARVPLGAPPRRAWPAGPPCRSFGREGPAGGRPPSAGPDPPRLEAQERAPGQGREAGRVPPGPPARPAASALHPGLALLRSDGRPGARPWAAPPRRWNGQTRRRDPEREGAGVSRLLVRSTVLPGSDSGGRRRDFGRLPLAPV